MRYAILAVLGVMLSLIVSGCSDYSDNLPPHIFRIDAETIIAPGARIEITAEADDPDNDALQYIWKIDSGTIDGSGSSISWTAPQTEGVYELVLEVSDGKDSDTESLKLIVWQERPGDYYPLAVGNTWIYRDQNGNQITFKIVDKIKIEGTEEESYILEKTSSDPAMAGAPTIAYLGKGDNVINQHAANVSPGSPDTMIFVPWLPLYKFPLIPGNSWGVDFRAKLPEGYYIGEGRDDFEVVDESTVTVPAGTFEHVMQVKETFTWMLIDQTLDETISRKWVAPDVGLIKIIEEQTRGGETYVNTLELLSYTLISP